METAAAWSPYEFQLANCTVEEPAGEVCHPPCLPMEYASTGLFGYPCGLQAYVPESRGGQQQLVEYYYSAPAILHEGPGDEAQWSSEVVHGHNRVMTENNSADVVVHLHKGEPKISDDIGVSCILREAAREFKADTSMMQVKMHRYPASLKAVDESYTVPRIVVIGPYHRARVHLLKKAEEAKYAAVYHCIRQSGRLAEDLYGAVRSAADYARPLYDKDVMAGISYKDFRCRMLLDACFLVQYMLWEVSRNKYALIDQSLYGFFRPNSMDIFHDVMLLENQIPWGVVKTVLSFIPFPGLERHFASRWKGILQVKEPPSEEKLYADASGCQDDYKPPHLLGLIRCYIVGRRRDTAGLEPKAKMRSISESAIELTKIGVKHTPNKTWELTDMQLSEEGTLFATLSMAPLSLDRDRASYLVNMAAHELCTVESFSEAPREEDSAVCSYLTLLAILAYREKDVHELRKRGVLHGGGGLTNEDALRFFTSIQRIRFGPCYTRIMGQIENYRKNRGVHAWLHAFFYNYWKIIVPVVTVIGTVFGIIVPLVSTKHA